MSHVVSQFGHATPVMNGEKLGNYRLTSVIASGALTTIHRARGSIAHDRAKSVEVDYVIKKLQPHYVNDPELRALLLAAGRLGLKVSSSRVLRTVAVHEDPEPFLVLECLDGVTLQALIASGTPGAARFAVPILVDVLEGLHALHTRRAESGAPACLVHGAPCARHIVITHDGTGHLVDLTHVVGPQFAWSARRDAFLIASEMAPEQALAPAHVDPRCDVFIVGSVLWHVLTGKSPFAAEDNDASLAKLLRMSIPAPSEAGAVAGRALDAVCARALQRSRAERYPSAAEMGAELRDKARQAGLWASREEIAGWLKGVVPGGLPERPAPATPGTALARRSTVIGFGLGDRQDQPAGSGGFRPSRPRRTTALEAGGVRVPHAASGMPADQGPFVPLPLAATQLDVPIPQVAGSAPVSGITPTGDQTAPVKSEDSSVFRRSQPPDVFAPFSPGLRSQSVLERSAPWHELQPSVTAPSSPPRRPVPQLDKLNKRAMVIGSAAAVLLLMIVLAFEDEFGSSRRAEHRSRQSVIHQPAPMQPAPLQAASAQPASAHPGLEPAVPPQAALPAPGLQPPSSDERAVQNDTLQAFSRARLAPEVAPRAPEEPPEPQRTDKRPSAPRVEREPKAPAPAAGSWSAPAPWDYVDKPKRRGGRGAGESELLPRNPY